MRGYRIKTVARLTGLSEAVLRTWERRYQVVHPVRTPGGYRTYQEADVERLRRLRDLVEAGHAISSVAQLSDDELAGLLAGAPSRGEGEDPPSPASEPGAASSLSPIRPVPPPAAMALVEAARALDAPSLNAGLARAMMASTPAQVSAELLLPVLAAVEGGPDRAPSSAVAVSLVRQAVSGLLTCLALGVSSTSARAVIAPGPEDPEGAAALRAALVAISRGFGVVRLGGGLPPGILAGAARDLSADLLVVSFDRRPEPTEFLSWLDAAWEGLGGRPLVLHGAALSPLRAAIEGRGAAWTRGDVALDALLRRRGGGGMTASPTAPLRDPLTRAEAGADAKAVPPGR